MKTLAELDAELELSKSDFTAAYIARCYRDCAIELERELAEAKEEITRLNSELSRLCSIPRPREPGVVSSFVHMQWQDDVRHYESHLQPTLPIVTGKLQIQTREEALKEANLQMKIEDPNFKEQSCALPTEIRELLSKAAKPFTGFNFKDEDK